MRPGIHGRHGVFSYRVQRGAIRIYGASKQTACVFQKANKFNYLRAKKCVSFRRGINANYFARAGGGLLCRGRNVSFLEAGNVSANHAAIFFRSTIAGGGQRRGRDAGGIKSNFCCMFVQSLDNTNSILRMLGF
jgi:hypothetical protein